MKTITITLAMILLASCAIAQGFRGNPWGSSPAYVKAHETFALISDEPGRLMFDGKIAGLDAAAWYEFIPNSHELADAGYSFLEKHSNPNLYIDDYHMVQGILTKKYGTPDVDTIHWNDDLYKGNSSNYGLGIAMGHMAMITKWSTGTDDIGLVLSGDNGNLNLGMVYSSKKLYPKLRAAKEAQSQKGF